MGVSQDLKRKLTEQRNLLNTYIARRKGAAAKKYRYQKRIGELEAIKRSINRNLDNCADDVRGQQQKMRNKLSDGVRKHAHTTELVEFIAGEFEKSPGSDSLCSQMLSEIDAEISRCRGELENAERDYNSANRSVNTTNNNIKTINRKIVEEQSKGGK